MTATSRPNSLAKQDPGIDLQLEELKTQKVSRLVKELVDSVAILETALNDFNANYSPQNQTASPHLREPKPDNFILSKLGPTAHPILSSVKHAATGAGTCAIGAAVLNQYGYHQFSTLIETAAKQGAVGGAVIGAAIGLAKVFGPQLTAGNENKKPPVLATVAFDLITIIGSSAVGNQILDSLGYPSTTKFEAFQASAVGGPTFGIAGLTVLAAGLISIFIGTCLACFIAPRIGTPSERQKIN